MKKVTGLKADFLIFFFAVLGYLHTATSTLAQKSPGKWPLNSLEPAVFPGGKEALHSFWARTILLPEAAFKAITPDSLIGMSAILILNIDAAGKATLDSLNSYQSLETNPDLPEVRKAAWKIYRQAVAKMPPWQPAKTNGSPISVTDTTGYSTTITTTSYAEYVKLNKEEASKPGLIISTQNLKTKSGKAVYAFMEKPPSFPGGLNNMKDYLEKNSMFTIGPAKTSSAKLVILLLIINETGKIEAVKVEKSGSAKMDAAAVKVIKAMPKWVPAKQGNNHLAAAVPLFLRLK